MVELGFSPPLQWRGEEAESSRRRGGDALVHRDGNCVQALGLGSVRSKQAGRESGEAKMPLYQGLNRKTAHQSVIFPSREIRGAARGQGSTVASVMGAVFRCWLCLVFR